MILVVGGIKGGCGKTTLATNLAVLRSKKSKTLLVDADEQHSCTIWANQRDSLGFVTNFTTIQLFGKNIYLQLERLCDDFEDIIVDVGGRDTTSQRSALSIADAYLVPFKPRSFDIWTLANVKTLISEIKAVNKKLACFSVLNQADPSGLDNKQASELLSECDLLKYLERPIGNRKAFCNAASDGLGVTELKVKDKKAETEICHLSTEIYGEIY